MKPVQKIEHEKEVLKREIYQQACDTIKALVEKYADETGGHIRSITITFAYGLENGSTTRSSDVAFVDINE